MKKANYLLCLVLIYSLQYKMNAQGSGNAGLSTITGVKPISLLSKESNNLKNYIGLSISKGEGIPLDLLFGSRIENPIWSTAISYGRKLNENWTVEAKITALSASIYNTKSEGLSDFYLTANHKLSTHGRLIFGLKVPFNNSNNKTYSREYEMRYQTSLGTYDLLLSYVYTINNWQLVAGFQQPLNSNKNRYYPECEECEFNIFWFTTGFTRSNDLLARISYQFKLKNWLAFTPSLLPIYHLTNDKINFTDKTTFTVQNSNGLTLNANAFFDFILSSSHSLQLSIGLPVITKRYSLDGLERKYMASLEYMYRF